MTERKTCPGGHGSPGAQKVCLSCGYLFAAAAGEALLDLRVEAGFSWLERNVYLAHGQDQSYTVVEILDYFVPELRQWQAGQLRPVLESLGMPLLRWECREEDGLPVLYSYYPASLWPVLQENVQTRLETAGLLPAEEVANISLFYQRVVNGLQQRNLVNPGLILPLLFCGDGRLALLEWEFVVPVDDSLLYPRHYIGYHPLGVEHKANQSYARAALSASLAQLLSGKRPALWYPQPMNWAPYRSIFQADGIRLLEAADAGKVQPVMAQRLYRPEIAETAAKANRLFNQGLAAWQAGNSAAALGPIQSAAYIYFNCPQILRYLALSASHQGNSELAQQAINQGLDIQPLACLYYEQAQIQAAQNKPDKAAAELRQAIEIFPLYPEAWYELGKRYYQLDRFNEAEKAYLRAWELRESAEYSKALYMFYMNRQLPQQAEHYAMRKSTSGAILKAGFLPRTDRYLEAEPFWQLCPDCGFTNDERAVSCQRCSRPLHLQPGDVLGNYRITAVQRLKDYANARMANIYLAEKGTESCLIKEVFLSHAQLWLFEREARLMSEFRHPNLVPLLESFRTEDKGYLVYRHFEGQTLQEILQLESCIDEAFALRIATTVGAVLQAMQSEARPLIHGDIKPSNLLLAKDGTLYLLDFESCRRMREDNHRGEKKTTSSSTFSEGISPPEQQAFYHLNTSSDTFALARTLIQALTGLPPYLSEEHIPRARAHWRRFTLHLQAPFVSFLEDCLKPKPEDRLQPLDPDFAPRLAALAALDPVPTPERVLTLATLLQDITLCQEPQERFKLSLELLAHESSTLTLALAAASAIHAGGFRKAYSILTRLLRTDPDYLQASWLLGDCCQQLNLPAEGIRALMLSLEKHPDHYQTHEQLGDLYMQVNEPFKALKAYERTMQLRPFVSALDPKLASLYAACGFYDKAIEHCRQALTFEQPVQHKFRLLHILGAVLGSKGLFESALEPLEKAFSYLPNQPDLLYDLALTHFMLKNHQRASGLFQLRLQNQPDHAPSLYHLALCAIELKQGPLAVTCLKTMSPEAYNETEYYFHLARAYTLVSDAHNAVACYRRALALMPDNPAIMTNLANLYLIMERRAEARSLLEKALQLDPGLKEARHSLELLGLKAG
ncbi:MAG: tetratricopeptide repeat protein [Candidatus Sericytochromatia bacterium]